MIPEMSSCNYCIYSKLKIAPENVASEKARSNAAPALISCKLEPKLEQ